MIFSYLWENKTLLSVKNWLQLSWPLFVWCLKLAACQIPVRGVVIEIVEHMKQEFSVQPTEKCGDYHCIVYRLNTMLNKLKCWSNEVLLLE